MSIQDDIFDVDNALNRSLDKKAFKRILERFNELEEDNERLAKENAHFKEVIKIANSPS